jgi:hypothetical protein
MTKRLPFACAAALLTFSWVASAYSPSRVAMSAKAVTGETHVLANGLDGRALNSFFLRFTRSDHEINSLGFMPTSDRIHIALADQNGDDKYNFDAVFLSSPSVGKRRKATGDCDGSHHPCYLPIDLPDAEKGNVFVLQGFKFKRKNTNDANVRRIMVRGNLPAKRVEVLFIDNGKTPYRAEVQFFTSVPSHYSKVGSITGSTTSEPMLKLKTNKSSERTVMSGFDVQFDNGDHHLTELSITPSGLEIEVVLRDWNGDDPFHATIDYAVYN